MICKCSALFQNLLLFKIKPVLEMSQHVTKKCKQIPAPFHCSYTHYILSETAFIKKSPYTSETPSLPLLTKFGRRSPQPPLRAQDPDPGSALKKMDPVREKGHEHFFKIYYFFFLTEEEFRIVFVFSHILLCNSLMNRHKDIFYNLSFF